MKKPLIAATLFLLPSIALADVSNITDLISQLQGIINALIPLLFSIALLGFLVGVIRYIWAAGNPTKIKEARGFIVFSIIAIAVMLSVWSLALFVKDSFFPNAVPGINFNGSNDSSTITNPNPGDTSDVTNPNPGDTSDVTNPNPGDCPQGQTYNPDTGDCEDGG